MNVRNQDRRWRQEGMTGRIMIENLYSEECPWRYKVMSMRDDLGIARSVRGYYRMRDAE